MVSLMGTVVIIGGLFVFLDQIGHMYSIETRQLVAACILVTIAVTFGFFRIKQYREKEVWSLDGDILSRGSPTNLRVDLSAVESVILGLPKSKRHNLLFAGKYRLKEQAIVDAIYSCTLVLRITANEYLPLYLFDFGGGPELMNEISVKLSDKVDSDHHFTDREKEVLKLGKQNLLVIL